VPLGTSAVLRMWDDVCSDRLDSPAAALALDNDRRVWALARRVDLGDRRGEHAGQPGVQLISRADATGVTQDSVGPAPGSPGPIRARWSARPSRSLPAESQPVEQLLVGTVRPRSGGIASQASGHAGTVTARRKR